jgi:hypothetical protein
MRKHAFGNVSIHDLARGIIDCLCLDRMAMG